jgi:AcrR family transcriptional regulator
MMANAGYLPGPERRKQILDGAKRVFASRGFHDTNISHICDELGIARGTLYQYFDSKRDVFAAIIQTLLDNVKAIIESTPPLVIPPGTKVRRADVIAFASFTVHRLLEAVFADEASLRIVMREAVGLDVQIDAVLRALDDIVIDRCASDLRVAQQAGIVRADVDVRAAALFVVGGIQKLALDAIARERAVDLSALATLATHLEMAGILSPEVT